MQVQGALTVALEEAGRWMSMEKGAWKKGGDDDGAPQHLKRRSQSTKSRRVFSPSRLVKKTECWAQRFALQTMVLCLPSLCFQDVAKRAI